MFEPLEPRPDEYANQRYTLALVCGVFEIVAGLGLLAAGKRPAGLVLCAVGATAILVAVLARARRKDAG
jgi:uncharacterized membrane protein